MRIMRESSLLKKLKEAYEKGLNVGANIGYQTRKMDENNLGTIIPGYDIDKDLEEILKRKGCSDG